MQTRRLDSYGAVAKLLHWSIALLFLGQILLGFAMTRIASMALRFDLTQMHKSIGLTVLVLATLRMLWHVLGPRPAPVASLSRLERTAAQIVQAALLAATIAIPLAGWALASTSTLGIPTLAFNMVLVPHLPLDPSEPAEAFWRRTHTLLAYGTAILALGHAAAALRHHFILGDDVLIRMLLNRRSTQTPAAIRRRSGDNHDRSQ